MKANVIL